MADPLLYVSRQLAPPGRIYCTGKQSDFGLTEESGKQGNKSDTDEGHAATGHELFHTMGMKPSMTLAEPLPPHIGHC